MKLTAIIEREGNQYVSVCPEMDIASQGDSVEQARDNLREASELFFETATEERYKSGFILVYRRNKSIVCAYHLPFTCFSCLGTNSVEKLSIF